MVSVTGQISVEFRFGESFWQTNMIKIFEFFGIAVGFKSGNSLTENSPQI
jgi:hypothetical protein